MIPPQSYARPRMPWFTDLRKIALAACVSAVFSNLIPIWNAIHIMLSVGATNFPWRWLRIFVVVVTALTAMTPVFYFALYKSKGPLRIPRRLRLLALSCAFVDGLMWAIALPEWVISLGADGGTGGAAILSSVRHPGTIGQLSVVLPMFSDVTYVLLLIAIFRQQSDHLEPNAPISRLLSLATKVTLIALGLVVSALLLGLLLTPYTFYKLRNDAFQLGPIIPSFGELFIGQLRELLQQSCLFAAPYIVYRSQRERIESHWTRNPDPEPLESGA